MHVEQPKSTKSVIIPAPLILIAIQTISVYHATPKIRNSTFPADILDSPQHSSSVPDGPLMGDVNQIEREVEHLRVVITRLGSVQPEGKSKKLPMLHLSALFLSAVRKEHIITHQAGRKNVYLAYHRTAEFLAPDWGYQGYQYQVRGCQVPVVPRTWYSSLISAVLGGRFQLVASCCVMLTC